MGKNIYDLLNEVETDITEYGHAGLSSEEKDRLKTHLVKEVASMERKNRKSNRKRFIPRVAAAVCALVLVAGGTTVLAGGMFSEAIEKLIGNVRGEKYEEEDVPKYQKIGQNSKAVEITGEEKDEYNTETEDQGLKVRVSDAYSDGYQLYFTATLTGSAELFNDSDWISPSEEWIFPLEGGGPPEGTEPLEVDDIEWTHYSVNGVPCIASQGGFGKAEDGSYVMMANIDLMSLAETGKLNLEGMDSVDVVYRVSQFQGSAEDEWDEYGEYVTRMDLMGDWSLKFPVALDRAQNMGFDINREDNGVKVISGEKTQIGLLVKVEYPDFSKEPYNDPFNDPDIFICDAEGNGIQWLGGYNDLRDDGTAGGSIMILYDGQKELSLKVVNKNVDNSVIAEIPFEVPEE